MPRTPTGPKRPRDTVANAVHVMKIATGELPKDVRGKTKRPQRRAKKKRST